VEHDALRLAANFIPRFLEDEEIIFAVGKALTNLSLNQCMEMVILQ